MPILASVLKCVDHLQLLFISACAPYWTALEQCTLPHLRLFGAQLIDHDGSSSLVTFLNRHPKLVYLQLDFNHRAVLPNLYLPELLVFHGPPSLLLAIQDTSTHLRAVALSRSHGSMDMIIPISSFAASPAAANCRLFGIFTHSCHRPIVDPLRILAEYLPTLQHIVIDNPGGCVCSEPHREVFILPSHMNLTSMH